MLSKLQATLARLDMRLVSVDWQRGRALAEGDEAQAILTWDRKRLLWVSQLILEEVAV